MKAAKNIHSFTKYDHGLQTGMIRICDLRDFSNHPFKVVKDAAMYELMESIRQEGVLVPLLVRPIRMRTEKGEGAGKHMDEKEPVMKKTDTRSSPGTGERQRRNGQVSGKYRPSSETWMMTRP